MQQVSERSRADRRAFRSSLGQRLASRVGFPHSWGMHDISTIAAKRFAIPISTRGTRHGRPSRRDDSSGGAPPQRHLLYFRQQAMIVPSCARHFLYMSHGRSTGAKAALVLINIRLGTRVLLRISPLTALSTDHQRHPTNQASCQRRSQSMNVILDISRRRWEKKGRPPLAFLLTPPPEVT